MNNYPLELLKKIDQLNESILSLEKEKQNIYTKLSLYKKEIEKNNSHLIGKKAICTHIDNPNQVECICTGIIALDDYQSIKPLFSKNGKKYIVDTYEWI
jgi:hypothetical protein